MSLGISLDGAKAADWAAVCIARHGWHCDVLPLPPQPVCCAVTFRVDV